MALLDGDLQAVFGSVFGPLLLDGTMITNALTPDGYGGFSEAGTSEAVKLMVEEYSEFTRAQGNIPDTDVKLIVLQYGVDSTPTLDSEITARGVTYSIQKVGQAPAQAAWVLQGRPTN